MKPGKCIWIGCCAGLVALAQTAALPDLKKAFESGVRAAQQQQRAQLKAAGEAYAAALQVAEQRLQERNNAQGVDWVRAERQRFAQAGDIPENATARGPLLRAQEEWREQTAQAKVAQAQRIAALTGKYMQDLAGLQQQLAGNLAGLAEVKDETDRVLDNSVIREAFALAKTAKPAAPEKTARPAPAAPAKPETAKADAPATPARPLTGPVTVGDYKFYPQGKEPPAKELKALRLEFPNVASRSAASAYALGASVFGDKDKLETNRQSGLGFAFKEEHGIVRTLARLTVTCHGRAMAEGSKLVVHYFSRPANALTEFHEERVEQLALPALPRGQAVVVDGTGVALGKFEHRGAHRSFKGGDEFYGLIVSLFDPAGKLLIQQCSSTALAKACPASLPAEKQQEPLRTRYGGGNP
jgi:hypothetical protein